MPTRLNREPVALSTLLFSVPGNKPRRDASASVLMSMIVAISLFGPLDGQAAVTTGLCGSNYGVQWSNTTYTSVGFTLANGPSTCVQYGLYGLYLGAPVQGQSLGHDDGAPSSLNNSSYLPLQASTSSSIGFVHSLARSIAGYSAFVGTDAAWGDVGVISGAPGLVQVTITGHLEGNQWFSTGSGSAAQATAGFTFLMGTLNQMAYGYTARIGNSQIDEYVNDFLRPITTQRTGSGVDLTYTGTFMLPTNTAIGLFAVLSLPIVREGGYADFNNTGAIDSITLPDGYSYVSSGGTVRSSGNTFSYVDPLAAVPEASSSLLLLAGLPLIVLFSRFNIAAHSAIRRPMVRCAEQH